MTAPRVARTGASVAAPGSRSRQAPPGARPGRGSPPGSGPRGSRRAAGRAGTRGRAPRRSPGRTRPSSSPRAATAAPQCTQASRAGISPSSRRHASSNRSNRRGRKGRRPGAATSPSPRRRASGAGRGGRSGRPAARRCNSRHTGPPGRGEGTSKRSTGTASVTRSSASDALCSTTISQTPSRSSPPWNGDFSRRAPLASAATLPRSRVKSVTTRLVSKTSTERTTRAGERTAATGSRWRLPQPGHERGVLGARQALLRPPGPRSARSPRIKAAGSSHRPGKTSLGRARRVRAAGARNGPPAGRTNRSPDRGRARRRTRARRCGGRRSACRAGRS